jgi:multiple sugar transport system substrate-binding protein
MRRWLIGITITALVTVACTGGSTPQGPVQTVDPSSSPVPVTLNVWGFYTEHELDNFTSVVDDFEAKYPWITVNMVPGKEFGDIVRGINAGTPIDTAIDVGPDNVAKLCDSGGWQDLNPYMEADDVDFAATFPAAVKTYTNYQGKQCALPMLTDAFGLYYNKDLLGDAGYTEPPTTLTELADMAKKLTTYNADGSIKVLGFNPLSNFYECPNMYVGNAWGAKWYNDDGSSAFGTDPAWQQAFQWDKDLADSIGYDKLVQFKADVGGANSEWNEQNAFQVGRVAMMYDGEWRTGYDPGAMAKLNYGTAPFPTADDKTDLYGSGLIGGTVVGIPSTAEHPSEAWLFVKEITTNAEFLTTLANKLFNVPTTNDTLEDPTLSADEHFKTFLDIAANPNSSFRPLTTLGTGDADLEAAFLVKWEAGKIPNLQQGLDDLAAQIDQEMQLG